MILVSTCSRPTSAAKPGLLQDAKLHNIFYVMKKNVFRLFIIINIYLFICA